MEGPNYVLEGLESDRWQLVQPLTLWSFKGGPGITVGDLGPFQLIGMGKSFEDARDDYCRNLIEWADAVDRRDDTLNDYMVEIGQSCLITATEDSIVNESNS